MKMLLLKKHCLYLNWCSIPIEQILDVILHSNRLSVALRTGFLASARAEPNWNFLDWKSKVLATELMDEKVLIQIFPVVAN